MQLCSLGQGTVSPRNIVPRCPRVLQVLPTMSDSSQVSQVSQSQLPDIVGSPCNTLGQRGTMLRGDNVPCPKELSCIVWTDLKLFLFTWVGITREPVTVIGRSNKGRQIPSEMHCYNLISRNNAVLQLNIKKQCTATT